jgi:hypothetical protein
MGMIGNLMQVTEKDLKDILKNPSLLEDRVDADEAKDDEIDLDKAWEGIFYALTGYTLAEIEKAKPPMAWVVFGDKVVDEDLDMGYGPAQYITPDQVKQLNQELDKVTAEQLTQNYDGKKMTDHGIYPEIWEETDGLDYLLEYFAEMKAFYKRAGEANKAVISFIS